MANKLSSAIASFIKDVFGSERRAITDLSVSVRNPDLRSARGIGNGLGDVESYAGFNDRMQLSRERMQRYMDYEDMESYPDIACLAGDSMVFTLDRGWVPISELASNGDQFYVMSYDKERRSLVPARCIGAKKTGRSGHHKKMVRVVLDNGSTIKCTADHLFLTKDERWVEAGDLQVSERLMPGDIRIRYLNGDVGGSYWQVHQPHDDSEIKDERSSTYGRRWVFIHRLVCNEFIGPRPDGKVVHHVDENAMDNDPGNLVYMGNHDHARVHLASLDNAKYFPEWTDERRRKASERMLGNTRSRGNVLSAETRHRMSISRKGRKKSEEWKRKIGDAHRMKIPVSDIESAVHGRQSIVEVAEKSWSTARRRVSSLDLESGLGNHRVSRVDIIDSSEDVYDLTVPEYGNFVCNGVVVHNSGLDIYADDATQTDSATRKTVWIESDDDQIKSDLSDLYEKRLMVEEKVWGMTRGLCKYGDEYQEIVVGDGGVKAILYLPPATMHRVEGDQGEVLGYVQSYDPNIRISAPDGKMVIPDGGVRNDNNSLAMFEEWRIAHMRLNAKNRDSQYGMSVIDPARWIWKRLLWLEDAAMLYRLSRSPSRYAFYIDVTGLGTKEAQRAIEEVKDRIKKRKFVNPTTNKVDMSYSPLSADEDFFLGVRNGVDSTRIDVLNGPAYQQMDDINYFQDKLYAALKIPKAFLSHDENLPSRATLSAEDCRFARTILRIQREIRNGLHKVGRVHLAAKQIDPSSVSFSVCMTVPSAIFEMGQMEIRRTRAELAQMMQEHVSLHYLLSSIYGLSDDEIKEITKDKKKDMSSGMAPGAMGTPMGPGAEMPGEFGGSDMSGELSGESSDIIRQAKARAIAGNRRAFALKHRPITEKELLDGNRESEKRILETIKHEMDKRDSVIGKRLRDLGGFLRDLTDASHRPSRK